jgi:hypothetical protein
MRRRARFGEGVVVSTLVLVFLVLLPPGQADAPRDKDKAVRLPEVDGVMATPIRFPDAARQKVAEAGLALLASCHPGNRVPPASLLLLRRRNVELLADLAD